MQLTDAGLAAWADVVGWIFRYVALMREEGPQRWVFDEMAQVIKTNML